MKVSITDLVYFPSCRRAWLWGKKYAPKMPELPLWVGSGVHTGLDTYFKKGRLLGSTILALQEWYIKSIQKISQALPDDVWAEVRDQYAENYEFCQKLLINFGGYDTDVQPNLLRGDVHSTERFLSFILPNGVQLVGKIDLILKSGSDFHIVDHKTYSERSVPSNEILDLDTQLTGYAYLFWKTFHQIPRSIGYNILLKSVPMMPAMLKKGSLSKSKSQSTTAYLYKQAIVENQLDPEEYIDILEYFEAEGWKLFFQEMVTYRSQAELESFERRILSLTSDITRAVEDPEIWGYSTPSTYTCKYCKYVIPCRFKDSNEDFEWYLTQQFSTESLY